LITSREDGEIVRVTETDGREESTAETDTTSRLSHLATLQEEGGECLGGTTPTKATARELEVGGQVALAAGRGVLSHGRESVWEECYLEWIAGG
jgi:hypothetical protein